MCPLLRRIVAAASITLTTSILLSPQFYLLAKAQDEAANRNPFNKAACDDSLQSGSDDNFSLSVHIVSIFIVLIGSGLGITIPILTAKRSQRRPWKDITFIIRHFGTGIIVATAFVHLIYEGFTQLENPCLSLSYGPTAPVIIMSGMFMVFFIDMLVMRTLRVKPTSATSDRQQNQNSKVTNDQSDDCEEVDGLESSSNNVNTSKIPDEEEATGPSAAKTVEEVKNLREGTSYRRPWTNVKESGKQESKSQDVLPSSDISSPDPPVHSCSCSRTPRRSPSRSSSSSASVAVVPLPCTEKRLQSSDSTLVENAAIQRQKYIDVCVLEAGIVFHSMMVGLGLGTLDESRFIPTFIAITFHQFCDGLAIGTRIIMVEFSPQDWWKKWVMCAIYSCITPVGIATGTGIRKSFNPNSPSVIFAIGFLDCLSAGVLLWGAMVDLLGKEFCSPQSDMANLNNKQNFIAIVALFAGVAVMSLIGQWA